MSRSTIWLLISILLICLLSGCQVGGAGSFIQGSTPEENNATYTGEPVTGDWVVMDLLDEPESLNPFTSTSASATNVYSGYIYESFLRTHREPPWDDEPLLAEALPEISSDHLVYKWKLRTDIRWHNGTPLTMRDAVFSLKAIMNPYVDDLPTKPYYAELDSTQLVDDYTLVMFCSQPYFLHQDFLGGFNIMPEHIFDPDGLMTDLSYFQVKNGSAFGRVAELLEKDKNVAFRQLIPSIVVSTLEKSVESSSGEAITWKEILKAVSNWDRMSPSERQAAVREFLAGHPAGSGPLKLAREVEKSTRDVLNSLPIYRQITDKAGVSDFPMRDQLQATCRDINNRIEKFGKAFNTHPQGRAPTVGSGPYMFESWKTGQEIVLKRNENYWRGEGYAYLDKIVWRVLTDVTASLVALKNGEIDFVETLQDLQYLTMTNRRSFLDKFVKSTFLIPTYSYLGWRNTHPIFKDKRVRLAMTHMTRRKDIRDKLMFGFAEIVVSNFYKYGPDYDTTIVPWEYDPEEAIRLLTEAGWADIDGDGILEKDTLEFRFEMLIPSGSATAQKVTSILREDLYMIGVEMSIRQLEWSVFINNNIRNHNFDACYLGWVFGMKGDPKQVWHSESAMGRGSNHIQFMNAEVDSLIDAARVEFDDTKRIAMYHSFQQILHEEQPYTFMFSRKQMPAYSKRFKGVRWYPFRPGYQFDEWFVPEAEQKFQ